MKIASSLGEILVGSGILTPDDLRRGLEEQKARKVRLGEALVALGLVTRDDLSWALSRQFSLSYIHPRDISVDPSCAGLLPEAIARRFNVAPLFEAGGELHVVLDDPLTLEALTECEEMKALALNVSLGPDDEIRELLERLYGSHIPAAPGEAPLAGPEVVATSVPEAVVRKALEDASGLALLSLVLDEASAAGARAVHFDAGVDRAAIRFRCDGVLVERFALRADWHATLIDRLRRLSGCAGRRPVDLVEGTLSVTLRGEMTKLSVAFLESEAGASAIVSLLPREMPAPLLDEIGLHPEALAQLELLRARGYGLWIVTGHQWEGSGVVVHALLRHLNRPDLRVLSFREDSAILARRAEFANLKLARHSTTPIDLDLAARNDFDLVLVGRLFERADIDRALEVAARGKRVIGTMDFRSPRAVLRFLLHYDFNRALLSSALAGILAQREVRVLCPSCRVVDELAPQCEFPARNEGPRPLTAYRGSGCARCGHSGVRRREFLLEFWPADATLGRVLSSADPFPQMEGLGGPSLLEMGMERVRRGETPFEDVAPLFEN